MPRIGETRDELLKQIETIRARLEQLDADDLERGGDAVRHQVSWADPPSHVATEHGEALDHRDVTELRRTRASLLASEARFRALVENSYDVINLFSSTGELLYTSPSIERVLGFYPEEMKKLAPSEVIHPDDFERADEGFRSCLGNPRLRQAIHPEAETQRGLLPDRGNHWHQSAPRAGHPRDGVCISRHHRAKTGGDEYA